MNAAVTAADTEARRQQLLLRTLLGDGAPGELVAWLAAPAGGRSVERGLEAYRAHAAALAERALGAAFPTLRQLLGADSFAALARHFWREQPPRAGDIALWGQDLADFVAAAPDLAAEPYLADVARLEWALHRAASAADAGPPQGLDLLATHDPAGLWLQLAPGTALLASAYPVVAIWQAHRAPAGDGETDEAGFAAARAALAAARGETALVARRGWQALPRALDAAEAAWTAAVLAGASLAQALHQAGPAFSFEAWLIAALRQQGLAAVSTVLR